MTEIIAGGKTEFAIDPDILELGALKFEWEGECRIVGPGDIIKLPAGTLHQSEALEGGAIYAIATRPPAASN